MTEPLTVEQIRRAVWAALVSRRTLTLDELAELTDILPIGRSLPYLNTLITKEFVAMRGTSKTSRGEYLPQFTLIRYTGPQAPYLDDDGRFIDPNRQKKAEPGGQCRGGMFADKGKPPTPSALIVAVARRIGGTFSSKQILEAAGLTGINEHTSAYLRGLTAGGWLFRLGPNEWKYAGTPPMSQVVEKLLTDAAGKAPVDMAAAHKKWGQEIPQQTIAFVVKVMRAEGWQITQRRGIGQKGRTQYQVEKRA